MSEAVIAASVLGADYARLGEELIDLTAAGVDRVHWDIMDGHFVPNLTFGAALVAACRSHTPLPFEAHLMIDDPDPWLEAYAAAGCDTVIVHVEACRHLHRALEHLRSLGVRAGAALDPATPLAAVRHVLDRIDLLLVMTVNPGSGGQAYVDSMETKVAEARTLIDRSGLAISIEVDGGISPSTAGGARAAGAELFVAGSAILTHPGGKGAAVAELRAALDTPIRRGLESSERRPG